MIEPITIDYETFAIEPRPAYPPKPVGVSIKYWGKAPRYYAWGHPSGNNCSRVEALTAVAKVYESGAPILCQNGKFDHEVSEVHLKLKVPHWSRCHDTLFLLFLHDPHARSFALKPAAAHLLGMPPEEQADVRDWLITNKVVRKDDKNWGAQIAKAPGHLVGKYANGDTIRTEKLFALLYPEIVERGMELAYERERKLMPILLRMEQRGVPVAHERLSRDTTKAAKLLERIDDWLRDYLVAPTLNIDADDQLLAALLDRQLVDTELLLRTKKKGAYSASAESLELGIRDKRLHRLMKYRGQLATYHGTFMAPWLRVADATGGLIHTQWHQTRDGKDEKSLFGCQTGRLSSSPNFQNAPVLRADYSGEFDPSGLIGWSLPPLPLVRNYIIPFEGDVIIDRDYSQQEPRILGHFEDGALLAQYTFDPWTDVHDFARDELVRMTGRPWDRKPVKNTNLGLIYGMGVDKLALKSNIPREEAYELKRLIMTSIYPGIKSMYDEMRARSDAGEPIRTWGGREYYCEEPKIIDGVIRKFDYKQLNKLIQGSAADCTKEAVILYDDLSPAEDKLLLLVHDQLVASVPAERRDVAMEILRDCMEMIPFDVLMLTEGKWSPTNWGELKDYDTKGVLCDSIKDSRRKVA